MAGTVLRGHCHDAALSLSSARVPCWSAFPSFSYCPQPWPLALFLGQPQAGSVPLQGSPLAVYNLLPVVPPGEQPSPWGGQGQVLVVAAGEQDVLPAWGLLLAWDRTREKGQGYTL